MSSFWITLFNFCVIVIVIIFTSNCQETEKPKQKKELSPARLRAEGDAAFSSRDYDKAIKYFNRLIDVEPNKHINFHKRGLTHLVKNNYWKAVRDWGKAIKLSPEFKSAYLYRGKTYKKLGKCSKALTDLNKVYELDSNTKNIGTLIEESKQCISKNEIAMNLLQQNKCDDAEPIINELLEISPFDKKINLGLAKCKFLSGDFQTVLSLSGNILRANPQNLEVLLLRGKAYYQLGEKDLALKHFKSGLKSDPEHKALKSEFKKIKKIYRILDNAEDEMNKKKWKDALEDYTHALTIDPENNHLISFVYNNRCKCGTRIRNVKTEEFEMSDSIRLQFCDEAIKYNPDSAEPYFYRGKMFKEQKKWDEAVANFKTAVSKNQGNREYQEALREAEFEKKKANRKDYYGILNIPQTASQREIKKGFRKCGLEHHPDQVQTLSKEEQDYHEALFKECVEAQDILSDVDVRARYDRGEDVLEQQQGGNRRGGFPFGQGGFPFGGFQNSGGGGGGRTFTFKFG